MTLWWSTIVPQKRYRSISLISSETKLHFCPLHITHSRFRTGIAKLYFNGDLFAIDINFFFNLSAAHRADYIEIETLTEVLSHFLLKHSSICWVTLKRLENVKRDFLDFLPTTSTFKKTVKETDQHKRTVELFKNELRVLYLSFTAFIVNGFQCFQSMTPRIHLLYTEILWLIITLMSESVKFRLQVDRIDGKKVLKSITDLLLINVTGVKNWKPIKMIDVGMKAKSCFHGLLEI